MNPRIMKEARVLIGPWCLIVAGALLPLFSAAIHHFHELATFFCGFALFGGIPFLAALSLGGEFQQRTISMLLGQPVGRMQIWKEKQLVLVVALLAAIPFFWFGWDVRSDLNPNTLGVFGFWVLATVCSSTYWTLLTRSTLGGLALGQVAQFLLGVAMVNLGLRIFGEDPSDNALMLAKVLGATIATSYAAIMFWLSWRKLVRFEATGGVAGEDLLMAGPRFMPRALGELLRCRPTGSVLNLIRKELRLLRPVWLVTLLFLVCWACIVITFRFAPKTGYWKEWAQIVPMMVVCIYMPLTVMLAGCLSLGEERNSGTHAWHLTLPVSARCQWFIKLVMALGTGVFCAMVVPFVAVSAGQALLDSPFGAEFKWDIHWEAQALVLALFASFPAFWCACAVKGTVQAALWTLPALAALCFVGAGGIWCGQQMGVSASALITWLISEFQLSPETLYRWIYYWREAGLIFPTLLVAIYQSYRMFRSQPSDRTIAVVRRLLPLAVMAFLGAFTCAIFASAPVWQGKSFLVEETRAAIVQVCQKANIADQAVPLSLNVDDLAKAAPMSEPARRWLRSAKITVAPTERGLASAQGYKRYAALIRFPGGSEYKVNFYLSLERRGLLDRRQ